MNFKQIKTTLYFIRVLCSTMVCGQTVTGVVSDGNLPLAGASIVVKGTSNGVVSDFDGLYSLDNVSNDAILQVSYIGIFYQRSTSEWKI